MNWLFPPHFRLSPHQLIYIKPTATTTLSTCDPQMGALCAYVFFCWELGNTQNVYTKLREVVLPFLHYVSNECIYFQAYWPTRSFLYKEQQIDSERPYSNWKEGRPRNKAAVSAYACGAHRSKVTQLTYEWWFCHGTNKYKLGQKNPVVTWKIHNNSQGPGY